MNDAFKRIEVAVERSGLSIADKAGLMKVIGQIDDPSAAAAIAELFESRPDWIVRVSDNYKAKQAAFAANDLSLMESIIAQEEAELEKLEQ